MTEPTHSEDYESPSTVYKVGFLRDDEPLWRVSLTHVTFGKRQHVLYRNEEAARAWAARFTEVGHTDVTVSVAEWAQHNNDFNA